jgi:hypothetical protein
LSLRLPTGAVRSN